MSYTRLIRFRDKTRRSPKQPKAPRPPKKKSAMAAGPQKPIIWVKEGVKKKDITKTQDPARGTNVQLRKCPACGKQIAFGQLSNHGCVAITVNVKVRKFSSLPRKQRLVKVKSEFQSKLSDTSGGWW